MSKWSIVCDGNEQHLYRDGKEFPNCNKIILIISPGCPAILHLEVIPEELVIHLEDPEVRTEEIRI